MSRAYVPGAPRTARDRAVAARRALRRRKRAVHAAVARFVARRTSRQLERAPIGPILVRTLPFALRAQFRPDYAVDLDGNDIDATILVTVVRNGGRRRDQFEVAIERRRCRIRRPRGGGRRPDATFTVALADMIRGFTGATAPHLLGADGRVETSGDTFLLARIPGMFRQPTRPAI